MSRRTEPIADQSHHAIAERVGVALDAVQRGQQFAESGAKPLVILFECLEHFDAVHEPAMPGPPVAESATPILDLIPIVVEGGGVIRERLPGGGEANLQIGVRL